MKNNEFRELVDHTLSGLSWNTQMQEKVLRVLDKEEKPVRKISMGLVLAVLLAIAGMAAALASGGFGILQFTPEKGGNKAYMDTVLTVGQTYDCDAFTLTVNEAAFDGLRMTATMELYPKEGADPVFILPSVRAYAEGKELETAWEGGGGWYTEGGVWAPNMSRLNSYDPQSGAHYALAPGNSAYEPQRDAVHWEIAFRVYRALLPIVYTEADEPGIDEEGWTDEQYAAHEQAFADAFAAGQLMLNQYGEPHWYLACIPQLDGIDGGEKGPDAEVTTWENGLRQGVFALQDEVVFRFDTRPIQVKFLQNQPVFFLPDGFQVRVERLEAAVDGAGLTLRITRTDGAPADVYFDTWGWSFAILARDAETSPEAAAFGRREEDHSLLYEARVALSQPTDQIMIVPCRESAPAPGTARRISEDRLVYEQQRPLTEEQQALMLAIDLPQ